VQHPENPTLKETAVNSQHDPAANSWHIAVRPDWLALRTEPILEPELPIVDPHHHLWDRAEGRYMMPDLLADLSSGHNVRATVYIQCRSMYRADGPSALRAVGETEFVNGVAAMSASGIYGPVRLCAGIVGHADLLLGAQVEEVLHAHLHAGGGRFRGIRHITAWDRDPVLMNPAYMLQPGLLADPVFRSGFARLAPLDLSFDAWLYHTQLDELTALARAYPETRIVLNHIGGPLRSGPYVGRNDEIFVHWKRGIESLASCPNVVVKLGGLGMRTLGFELFRKTIPASSEELASAWRPYIETCIEAFGAHRCMFESNFPVDKISCSYTVLWNAFKRIAAGCSAHEKSQLFCATASRVYCLPEERKP
jgi:L-fuconolactonase